ncbi:MFS general substrate transporter [Schizopora paradoxa]|uniref:MFS general substrate transporter n=1 Tax=Schizopora paradoxa TaxID=27342 RepID=A0A0H2S4Q1_9AGAM|nr:MFS general substrate transporter [Schizopora paradoxa]
MSDQETKTLESIQPPFDLDDLHVYHEKAAGRLVIDPEEAFIEFGEEIASSLKLTKDGKKILWPQPYDDACDPQNWSDRRKNIQLLIVTLAAITPNFYVAIGIAGVFVIAETFGVSPDEVTSLTTSWSVFLLGWAGIFAIMLMHRIGRLPVLFWSQLISLGFLIGCTLAPNLKTFAAMRYLTAFFSTVPQVTGLYVITDIYPFHVQARKLNIWVMGWIISPSVPPFVFGFLVPRAGFRWAYGIGVIYGAFVLLLIVTLGRETLFDRGNPKIINLVSKKPSSRISDLFGLSGAQLAKYRTPWRKLLMCPINLIWRPHLLSILVYEAVLFGFSIGMNLTVSLFLGEAPPVGFGKSLDTIAAVYVTPVVSVLAGQVLGTYLNDYIASWSIKRNKGVFEAESRLWMCYISLPFYIAGLIISGFPFQDKLPLVAVVFGWGIREVAVMTTTVAVYAYANNCFPRHEGEVSALLNLARTLGGFAVPYFQIPWAKKNGALQAFGCEAAIVAGLFLICIPTVHLYGSKLRVS